MPRVHPRHWSVITGKESVAMISIIFNVFLKDVKLHHGIIFCLSFLISKKNTVLFVEKPRYFLTFWMPRLRVVDRNFEGPVRHSS